MLLFNLYIPRNILVAVAKTILAAFIDFPVLFDGRTCLLNIVGQSRFCGVVRIYALPDTAIITDVYLRLI